MFGSQTGVENHRRVVQRVDMLLTEFPSRQTLNVNKLVEVTLYAVLFFSTAS